MSIFERTSEVQVLLVQPDQGNTVKKRIFQPGVEIPLNVAYLEAYLEREGISGEILDMRIYPHPYKILETAIRKLKPRIVGISAFTSEISNAGKVARIIKDINKDIVVVIGGYHASALPIETLTKFNHFDYLVFGEGELTFTELIKKTEGQSDISHLAGVAYREDGQVKVNPQRPLIESLDNLPLPARNKLEMSKYVPSPGTGNYLRLPSTGIIASRGCPYRCNYCSKGVWGSTIRFRSPESVIQEIEYCIDKYRIHDFRFYDDALTLPNWNLKSLCEMIIKKKLNISWNCYSRVNNITLDILRIMKEAGCYHIKYGIEFGTEKALKLANKNASLEQARAAVSLTKKVGIECKGSFMVGIPGENVEDCKKTISFAIELSPDLVAFYPFDLFPGSKFYKEFTREEEAKGMNILDRSTTEELVSQAYKSFYFRFAYILQRIKRLLKHPLREAKVDFNGLKMILLFYLKKTFRQFKKKLYQGL